MSRKMTYWSGRLLPPVIAISSSDVSKVIRSAWKQLVARYQRLIYSDCLAHLP